MLAPKRDKVCLYIAQHRMTGTVEDIAQYILAGVISDAAAGA